MKDVSQGTGAMTLLTHGQIELIVAAAKRILAEIGTRYLNEKAIDYMRCLGLSPAEECLVKIPETIIDEALASAPKAVMIYDRDGNPAMDLSAGHIYFGSLTNGFKYLDPATDQESPLGKIEEAAMVRLTDALPHIHYAMNSGTLCDCEHGYPGAEAFAIVYENTTKPIGFTTNDFDSCVEAVEMAATLAGGTEQLASRPFLVHYAEPISPLVHNADSCRKLMFLAEKSVPVTYTPYTMMGGTGPMDFAAALSMVTAEIMAGLVLHQAVRPGAPFIMGGMPSYLEMRHSIGVMGAPELHMLVAAEAEISNYLGFPFFGTAGCSDARTIDLQAASEGTMSIMSALMSKANLIHDLGLMGHGESTSPEMLVLSDELIGMLYPFRKGIEVNDKTLAHNVIAEVGPGGHFLTHKHTVSNFRMLSFSKLMDRSRTFMDGTLGKRLKRTTLELLENHQPKSLEETKGEIIAAFRARWRAEYAQERQSPGR